MSRMLSLALLLLVQPIIQQRAPVKERPAFRPVFQVLQRAGPIDAPSAPPHSFSLDGETFVVQSDGRGRRKPRGGRAQPFRLPVPKDCMIDMIAEMWYGKRSGDLLLAYELSDGEFGTASFVRLDGRTLEPRWTAEVPGGNIGPPLVEGAHVYVTAIGFIGRLNLQTGQYAWRHSDLYQPFNRARGGDHFNAFLLPIVRKKEVLFVESGSGGQDRDGVAVIKAVRVKKQNGGILSIDRLPPAVASALSNGTHPAYRSLKYLPYGGQE
jgi:hypothetical protein